MTFHKPTGTFSASLEHPPAYRTTTPSRDVDNVNNYIVGFENDVNHQMMA